MNPLNPYQRGSRLGAMMPLILAATMLPPIREDNRGVLPWPKGQPWNAEKQKRHAEERIEAARLKRERKAAKRASKN